MSAECRCEIVFEPVAATLDNRDASCLQNVVPSKTVRGEKASRAGRENDGFHESPIFGDRKGIRRTPAGGEMFPSAHDGPHGGKHVATRALVRVAGKSPSICACPWRRRRRLAGKAGFVAQRQEAYARQVADGRRSRTDADQWLRQMLEQYE